MNDSHEVFISVDIETSGPIPGEFSMLTIGACSVDQPDLAFSCKLKPITRAFDPKALEVTGLSMDDLANEGLDPAEAMTRFADWLNDTVGAEGAAVFVGLNAPFDWSFVNYYFHRFIGTNPFGFTALDIKALYMGAMGGAWRDTRSSKIAKNLHPKTSGTHDALQDARHQAELFRLIRQNIAQAHQSRLPRRPRSTEP